MVGLKDLKEELANTNNEMKEMNAQISKMAENTLTLSHEISNSMKEMTTELIRTNNSVRESLKITSEAIITMKDAFTVALEMNIKDALIKSLGLDSILPDFLKKK